MFLKISKILIEGGFMPDHPKSETNTLDRNKEKKQNTGYGNWLFRTKGTAAEPWPTAEELWNDPGVKKIIKAHNAEVRKRNGSSK